LRGLNCLVEIPVVEEFNGVLLYGCLIFKQMNMKYLFKFMAVKELSKNKMNI